METNRSSMTAATTASRCIWSKAGVVRQRTCSRNFECQGCRFDRALRKVARENRALKRQGLQPSEHRAHIVSWQDKLMALPPSRRPCIHTLKERIDFKRCHRAYRCTDCEFDQYFDDAFAVHAVLRPIEVNDVHGIKFPQGYYLHRGHAWVRLEQNQTVRIGLDDFVLRLLGPFDTIETPLIGQMLVRGRPDIRVKRGARSARIQSPVSGIVTGVHNDLRTQAGPAEKDPYGAGWAVKLQTKDLRQDLGHLLIGSESVDYIESETECLYRTIESTLGPLMADGGRLSGNLFGKMPQLGWNRLVRQFLKT